MHWNEQEGELTARERLIAVVAFKIGTERPLTRRSILVQLCELPDEDYLSVQKMVALFTYWQQLTDALGEVPTPASEPPSLQPPFDPSPYFHESNPPQTAKVERNESYSFSTNGFVQKHRNGVDRQ